MSTTTKTGTAVRPPKNTELSLRVNFSRDELFEIAKKQNEVYAELNRAEDEKKSVGAQLKAKCEGLSSRLSELQAKFSAGYEYRTVPCSVVYDDPKSGMKTTYRLDTEEVVTVEAMTGSERQAELALEAKAPEVAPVPASDDSLTPSVGDQIEAKALEADANSIDDLSTDSWDGVTVDNVERFDGQGAEKHVDENLLSEYAELACDLFFDVEFYRRPIEDSRSELVDYIVEELSSESQAVAKLIHFMEANVGKFAAADVIAKWAREICKALGIVLIGTVAGRDANEAATPTSNESEPKASKTRTKVTDDLAARVIELTNAGRTVPEIAADTGLSVPSIYNIRKSKGLVKARGAVHATPRMVGPDGCVATQGDGDINPTEDESK